MANSTRSTLEHNRLTDHILASVGVVNPYNRQGSNLKSEFYIYNMGFLASYIASLAEEDPWVLKRLQQHIKQQQRKTQ